MKNQVAQGQVSNDAMQYLLATLFAIAFFTASRAQHSKISIDYYNKDNKTVPDTVFQKEVEVYAFRKGDIIADIGAGSGYFEKVLSKYCDNLTVYATDIDPLVFTRLTPMLESLMINDHKEIEYKTTIGQEKSTHLPLHMFDKIIIRNTFHHFSYPDEMLRNCKEVLNDGGRLYIVDILIDEVNAAPACHAHLTRKAFLSYITRNGFVLSRETNLQYDDFKCFEFQAAN